MHLDMRGTHHWGQGHTAGCTCSRPSCYLRTHVSCSSQPNRHIAASLLPKSSTRGESNHRRLAATRLSKTQRQQCLHRERRTEDSHRARRLQAQSGLCGSAHAAARGRTDHFCGQVGESGGDLHIKMPVQVLQRPLSKAAWAGGRAPLGSSELPINSYISVNGARRSGQFAALGVLDTLLLTLVHLYPQQERSHLPDLQQIEMPPQCHSTNCPVRLIADRQATSRFSGTDKADSPMLTSL